MIKTAGITCRFINIGSNNLLSDCCGKADPWTSHASPSEPLISVTEVFQSDPLKNAVLLSEERDVIHFNRVYQASDGCFYQTLETIKNELLICWKVDLPANEITLVADNTNTSGYFAFEHAGTILPQFFLKYGLCTMHGVLMEYHDSGIILTADSGVGKTTHARLWRDHKRALIINGDRILFGKENNTWTGYGLPWSGSSGEQINRTVPIKAIVEIVRGETNHAEKLSGLEAFQVVYSQLLTPAWSPESAILALDMISGFTEEIPVWRLHCTPDKKSADVLESALF